MSEELFAKIVAIVDEADAELDALDEEDDNADSTAVDIDYDAYQAIHKLLRLAGKLKGS